MENLILAIITFAFIAFIIGLIKPKVVFMPSRARSSLVYLSTALIFSVIGSKLYPNNTTPSKDVTAGNTQEHGSPANKPGRFEYSDKTLKDYRREPQYTRKDIVAEYVKYKDISSNYADNFYSCLSQMSYTKSSDLSIGEVLGWCYDDYSKNAQNLLSYINLDNFTSQFSTWDGAYKPLEKLIKKSMKDDSSYKHVETTYRLNLGEQPHAIVDTTFKGANSYGGIVKEKASVKVDIKTGEILEILSE